MFTEWTGQLTENQVKTLNSWPLILIPESKSHRVEIDLESRAVFFVLRLKPKAKAKQIAESSLALLEKGVWAILGDSWYTVVKVGKTTLHQGARRKRFSNRPL
jgi:hypothetical protein